MHVTSALAVSPVFQRRNILHRPMMQWRLLHILYVICQPCIHLPRGVVWEMVGKNYTLFSALFDYAISKRMEQQQTIKTVMRLKEQL